MRTRSERAKAWANKFNGTGIYLAVKGFTRGKYGSQEEEIRPAKAVNASKSGWVDIGDIKNPPRDLQERYKGLYLEEKD